jgi:hypothetical protein
MLVWLKVRRRLVTETETVVPPKDIKMTVPSKVTKTIVPSKTTRNIVLSKANEAIRHITCTSLIICIA